MCDRSIAKKSNGIEQAELLCEASREERAGRPPPTSPRPFYAKEQTVGMKKANSGMDTPSFLLLSSAHSSQSATNCKATSKPYLCNTNSFSRLFITLVLTRTLIMISQRILFFVTLIAAFLAACVDSKHLRAGVGKIVLDPTQSEVRFGLPNSINARKFNDA